MSLGVRNRGWHVRSVVHKLWCSLRDGGVFGRGRVSGMEER